MELANQMDKLAERRARSGALQGMAGLLLLILASLLWLVRDFFPALASTRVVATAIVYTLHDGTEVQLQRAFAQAKTGSAADASFEPDKNPLNHGTTYYLSVTDDTPAQAKAGLATLTDALRNAFPSAERNLQISPNNSTVPAPNDWSRRISFGVSAALVILMMGAQLLIVIGGYREGMNRTSVLASLAMPFVFMILPESGPQASRFRYTHSPWVHADWRFLLLLLALTPVSVILALAIPFEGRRWGLRPRRARRG